MKQAQGDELVLIDDPDGQRARTSAALAAVLEEYEFQLGVLVTLVRDKDGKSHIECSVSGSGPPGLGPHIGKLLHEAADKVEQDMNAQSAKFSRGLS